MKVKTLFETSGPVQHVTQRRLRNERNFQGRCDNLDWAADRLSVLTKDAVQIFVVSCAAIAAVCCLSRPVKCDGVLGWPSTVLRELAPS